ncbi:ExbD/TolR family protein [Trichlorobacter lovleyi]|uniref:Biopolymer transport protein ExbD/TolR n=1 Tax=Trichlorobacter lovleyi (strain ATCC BAA-1151 / DSM 17278 / SZ) TaxID=398767 RepID=B3EBT6_TRIL1|nr:biopolymer transporter ExbD [Trichlorobacter lovleyi]ACD97368.1 Biopolymer transport protein ExbD/TolR [Trichlorobacter lovleyi SZ]
MEEKEVSVINVIPFIDIMLVLLTIVLTTSTFIAQGSIPIQLPKAAKGASAALQGHTIEINRDGRLFLDGQPTSLPLLKQSLSAVDRAAPVLIRADRSLLLQGFVEVLDSVTQMGFKKLSLQTESING